MATSDFFGKRSRIGSWAPAAQHRVPFTSQKWDRASLKLPWAVPCSIPPHFLSSQLWTISSTDLDTVDGHRAPQLIGVPKKTCDWSWDSLHLPGFPRDLRTYRSRLSPGNGSFSWHFTCSLMKAEQLIPRTRLDSRNSLSYTLCVPFCVPPRR
jgi:hypothetical protein